MIIRENIKISDLVTMRIGGVARYVFEIDFESDLLGLKDDLEERGIKDWYFLGDGANTFATDSGFDGAIIINKLKGITVNEDGDEFEFIVDGGVEWDDFVLETTARGWC